MITLGVLCTVRLSIDAGQARRAKVFHKRIRNGFGCVLG